MNKKLRQFLEEEFVHEEYKASRILETGEDYAEVRERAIKAAQEIREAERRARRRKITKKTVVIAACCIFLMGVIMPFRAREAYAKQFCFVFSQSGDDLNYSIANVPEGGRIRKVTVPHYIPEGYELQTSDDGFEVKADESGANLCYQNFQGNEWYYTCTTLNVNETLGKQNIVSLRNVGDLDGDAYLILFEDGLTILMWISEKNETLNSIWTSHLDEDEILRIAKSCR